MNEILYIQKINLQDRSYYVGKFNSNRPYSITFSSIEQAEKYAEHFNYTIKEVEMNKKGLILGKQRSREVYARIRPKWMAGPNEKIYMPDVQRMETDDEAKERNVKGRIYKGETNE